LHEYLPFLFTHWTYFHIYHLVTSPFPPGFIVSRPGVCNGKAPYTAKGNPWFNCCAGKHQERQSASSGYASGKRPKQNRQYLGNYRSNIVNLIICQLHQGYKKEKNVQFFQYFCFFLIAVLKIADKQKSATDKPVGYATSSAKEKRPYNSPASSLH